MRVRVIKSFTAYWNYAVTQFNVDAEADGDLARHLAENTPEGSVEILEADSEPKQAPPAPDAEPDTPIGSPEELNVEGTAAYVLAWVGDDPERAADALAAEQARDKPRSTLVKQLQKLVGSDE